jgi:cytochrome b561
MQWRNTLSRYGIVARSLHWLIVLGIVVQYLLAEAQEDKTGPSGALTAMDWHMSIGITLLALAAVRLMWRAIDVTPDWPTSMRGFERLLARVGHVGLYALLFAIPLSGWLLASVEGDSLRVFGWFNLPALAPVGTEERAHLIEEVHEVLFNALFVLAILHLLAALKHHFIDRDDVLKRMLLGGR